ncbi:hypothetical protein LQG66_03950 [Bradyrhizobium ontarionense]|uniref:Uncharacterized protein n=1 Tax=Bradyrhizobium ontarionense TaxID=2898149 RepID=A0ABY3RDI7_9BRAD|nr:hypothetical protein [Bradyrhizobium sp. A19]UFZ05480.1 hypothetical protein LQG66_03950 [Bradyrhizobium sp. A19]
MTAHSLKLPSFADQVLSADPLAAAARIEKQGARAAIAASTVEIVAMALLVMRLKAITDLTYDMFKAADRLDSVAQDELLRETRLKISVVGASLEALGYGDVAQQQEEE